MSHAGKIDIKVKYSEDDDKLHDHKVDRDETVGSFKSRVLVAFGLTKGVDHKGELITFGLFHDHKGLKDQETLGSVAGDAEDLHLKLERERHYFYYKKHEILSSTKAATGAQIKAMIKAVDPEFDMSHTLIEEGHGEGEDKVIEDNQTVSLKVDPAHPVKHFFSKPPTNFGGALMLSRVTERQFERVKERYPAATLQDLPSGSALVSIPNIPLPAGWSAASTSIHFLVPVGYPGPPLDCFWADHTLTLAAGGQPQASNVQPIPETNISGRWFSWHVVNGQANWNPNRDDLMTFVSIVIDRLRRAQ